MRTSTVENVVGRLPGKSKSVEESVCPGCGTHGMAVFHEVRNVPANSCILLPSEISAREVPLGDISLAHCSGCGFIFNTSFDLEKTEYSGRYEETQGFSGTFNRFHEGLARRLIQKYGLRDKNVLEIGCGKAEFLTLLAELGNNRCVGIDPGVKAERLPAAVRSRVTCIADFYSEKYGDHPVDFLVCKMTLEHIATPLEFLRTVRRGLGEQTGAIVFFQLPEALRILRQCAFEDIYHEHCGYFTPGSLARLFRRAGFEVLAIDVEYDGQYLTIEARPSDGDCQSKALACEDDQFEIGELVASFPSRLAAKLSGWRKHLGDAHALGWQIALWGSGSKAVSFLSTLDPGGRIQCVTDVNPNRHGYYMPKSGQRIMAPGELVEARPDLVIVMNEIYEQEIRADLAAMGLAPEIRCL
ncbi:MAG: class I SAM-dependent methyltransferase [Hyphomicrobiaceae bacterium]